MFRNRRQLLAVVGIALIAASCAAPPGAQESEATSIPATPTASSTPTPAGTPTSTPIPTPTLHPLAIEAMRLGDYPGSEVVIEETLEPGANYSRYLASYLSEGYRIYALLTVPFAAPPESGWPVIIFNHGFIPPDEYRTTERYIAYVDNLARSGYIVFRPDYRGHGDSEGPATGAYGSPGYLVDVLNATASMRRYPLADPERVGMWGHSMGGYLTLRAMVIDGDLRAGVIWAGVVGSYADLYTRWRRTPTPSGLGTPTASPFRGWRASILAAFGPPEENPQLWDSISANAYLTDLSGPLQLHHGTADTSVPYEFSEGLHQQALAAGAVVELYTYPGADHNLSGPFTLAMGRTIQFFDTYLKGP